MLLKGIPQVYLFQMPENSHHYNVCTLFLKFLKMLIVLCIVSKSDPDRVPGPEKKRTLWKSRTSRTKNVVIIVQGLVYAQITFENCTINFYFENSEICQKRRLLICSPHYHGTFLHVYAFSFSVVLIKNVFLWN